MTGQTPKTMKTRELTPQQKYDLLTKDFLERDGDTFVRVRQSGRLGWEDTLPKDSAYSAAILSPKDGRELLLNATKLARQMITAMDTPYKVNLYIDSERSYTDSKSVFVATKVLDDESLPLGKRLDTFLGLAVHEGSHLLYTDFEASAKSGVRSGLIHQIANILEDEMIERKLGERKPGLANFLKATKYYYFGRYEAKAATVEEPAARLFNAILCMVRYPAALTREMIDEFADELLEARDILTPYPDGTAACIKKAKDIFELFRRYMTAEKSRQEKRTSSADGGKDKSGEGKTGSNHNDKENGCGNSLDSNPDKGGCCDTRNDAGDASGERPENNAAPGRSSGGNDSDDSGVHNQDPENGDTDSDGRDHGAPLTDAEVEKILEKIIEAASEIAGGPTMPGQNPLKESDMASAAKSDRHLTAKECDGELERGSAPGTVVIRKRGNEFRYKDSLARVRRHIPATAAALRQHNTGYKYSLTGMRSGLLDTNKLCEARQGVPTVYTRKGEVKTDRINVVLVVDESGSMEGLRERLARDTAVLLNEAVGGIQNVSLSIYGYTTGKYGVEIYPYREGSAPGDRYALGAISAHNGTPTAHAILESATRIRKASGEKVLMFIVSDGACDGGTTAVRSVTDRISREGITVIGVSIASALPETALKQMYDEYIAMKDISDLAGSLAKTVKNAVLKNTRKTTSTI